MEHAPRNNFEGVKTEKLYAETQNPAELLLAISRKKWFSGTDSSGESVLINAVDVQKAVAGFMTGDYEANVITRQGGLREQAIALQGIEMSGEAISDLVQKAENIDELSSVIHVLELLKTPITDSSNHQYTAELFSKMIDSIQSGKNDFRIITSQYGLREKIEALLSGESIKMSDAQPDEQEDVNEKESFPPYEMSDRVRGVRSFEDLFSLLKQLSSSGEIAQTKPFGFFDSLEKAIAAYRNGKSSSFALSEIPEFEGIRIKVIELTMTERVAKATSVNDILDALTDIYGLAERVALYDDNGKPYSYEDIVWPIFELKNNPAKINKVVERYGIRAKVRESMNI